jgi:hypothetical protein
MYIYVIKKYFYQTEQVRVNKIVGKAIDPPLEYRLEDIFVI